MLVSRLFILTDTYLHVSGCLTELVRLINGSLSNSGWVEAFVNGAWFAVSGQMGFRNANAIVVCRQLNLPWTGAVGFVGNSKPSAVSNSLGPGSLFAVPFNLVGLACTGSEASITNCPYYSNFPGPFSTGVDAGLREMRDMTLNKFTDVIFLTFDAFPFRCYLWYCFTSSSSVCTVF